MSDFWCPECHRACSREPGAVALCEDGHGPTAMYRLGHGHLTRPSSEAASSWFPYQSACDVEGVCQYDRQCAFYHQSCRFDGLEVEASA